MRQHATCQGWKGVGRRTATPDQTKPALSKMSLGIFINTSELEQARWKATLDSRVWCTPLAACALASCILEEESVGLVDSASEKNKARAVVERSVFF